MDMGQALAALGLPAQYVALVLALCGLVAVICTFLPAPKSRKGVYMVVWTVLNVIAQNYNKAKNAEQPPPAPFPPTKP